MTIESGEVALDPGFAEVADDEHKTRSPAGVGPESKVDRQMHQVLHR